MTKHDLCEFCDGKIEYRIIRARFNFKGQTIYVDNVPTWVCVRCGEQYFDAPIYKRLEEIAKHRNQIINTVSFPLAEYNMAIG
jgi:YgiT-type zinc finger domain-containing protein